MGSTPPGRDDRRAAGAADRPRRPMKGALDRRLRANRKPSARAREIDRQFLRRVS